MGGQSDRRAFHWTIGALTGQIPQPAASKASGSVGFHRQVRFVVEQRMEALQGGRGEGAGALGLGIAGRVRPRRKPHALQEPSVRLARLRPRQAAMTDQNFDNLLANCIGRIERGHRLLNDHGDAIATQIA